MALGKGRGDWTFIEKLVGVFPGQRHCRESTSFPLPTHPPPLHPRPLFPSHKQVLTGFVAGRDGLHCEFARELCESAKKHAAPAIGNASSQAKKKPNFNAASLFPPRAAKKGSFFPIREQEIDTSFQKAQKARSKRPRKSQTRKPFDLLSQFDCAPLFSQLLRLPLSLSLSLSLSHTHTHTPLPFFFPLSPLSLAQNKPSARASATSPMTPGSGTASGGIAGR